MSCSTVPSPLKSCARISTNENFQKQFWLEARSAANLTHPNIVTVHDFGSSDDLLYIVMEHIPGKDLKQLVRDMGRFPYEKGIPLMIQACAGVGYAHRAGLVHCDIKPHNMLVYERHAPQSHRLRYRACPRHHQTR